MPFLTANPMHIQINTDNHIKGSLELSDLAMTQVGSALIHLSDHITRVEVHLSDENSHKGGSRDKRCVMEARLERHQPIAVTDEAETIEMAIGGAADKLKRAVEHTIGKLHAEHPQR